MRTLFFILIPFFSFAQGDYEKVRSNYHKAELLGLTGAGVKIAIIDQGGTRVGTRGVDEVWADWTFGYDFIDDDTVVTSTSHHGNFVLSVIKSNIGIAPDATVYVLKAFTDAGEIDTAAVQDALQYCIDNDIDVINISQGTGIRFTSLDAKIFECEAAGIAIIAAAGNSASLTTTNYPGALPGVAAINAIGPTGLAPFLSVTNPEDPEGSHGITIAASGVNCDVIGRTGVPVTSNGTSFSAPWLTGCFAIYKQRYPTMTNEAIMQFILDRAIKQPSTTNFGAGRPTF